MNRYASAAVFSLAVLTVSSGMAVAAPDKETPKPKTVLKADTPSEGSMLSGKVVETMNAGGYTYVCLEKKGKKTWVAVPETKATVGQEMSFQPGAVMHNFTSKTLNKTFDQIVFSSGPASASASAGSAMPAGHPAAAGASAAAPQNVKVEKATGANAYTVAEIFEKRAKLDKKTAVVRGKVVKVSKGIMGSNWLHLQDGTGESAKATNDLVVTTQDLANVGDVVTIKGTVAMDKDFGAGYAYKVLIEKATVKK